MLALTAPAASGKHIMLPSKNPLCLIGQHVYACTSGSTLEPEALHPPPSALLSLPRRHLYLAALSFGLLPSPPNKIEPELLDQGKTECIAAT
eukprot:361296-Pelagomonas_calceolata.AAC.2